MVLRKNLLVSVFLASVLACLPLKDLAAANPMEAELRIWAQDRSAYPVPKYLTGKFCEHLGSNIYKGMDAQLLINPTFADYAFSAGEVNPDGGVRYHWDREQIARMIRRQAPEWGWPNDATDRMVQDRLDGLACWWMRQGARTDVLVSPDNGTFGQRAQRVEAEGAGQGIAQWTYLPLHRVRKYEFEMIARSPDLSSLVVSISGSNGARCAEMRVEGLSTDWKKLNGMMEVPAGLPADSAYRFAVETAGPGQIVVARVLLRPADHVGGADPDVIRLLKESALPLLRWPGGNFVSAYHWQDGIGPSEARPTLPNGAWGGVETNLFGTDEFIAFCRSVGCDPMICVNAGSGTPEEAARWIQYCNGPVNTPMGALRAANGHPEPYRVQHWEIGNELWGRWQFHWTTPKGYVDRYKRFSKTMLEADPGITLYACGAPITQPAVWNETWIQAAAMGFTRITDHPLIGGSVPAETDPLDVYRSFMAVPNVLEEKWHALEQRMADAGIRQPRLSVTELQLFARAGEPFKPDAVRKLTPENLVRQRSITEALYDVLIYHAAVRLAPFVEMVTHSATVNHGAGLRKRHERVYAEPAHHAQTLFSQFAGATPVRIALQTPTVKATMVLPDIRRMELERSYGAVDAMAAVTRSNDLLVSVIHRGTDGPIRLTVALEGFGAAKRAEVCTLSADLPWTGNTFEKPDAVKPSTAFADVKNNQLILVVQPYTLLRVRIPHR